jgi:hypothetical protein
MTARARRPSMPAMYGSRPPPPIAPPLRLSPRGGVRTKLCSAAAGLSPTTLRVLAPLQTMRKRMIPRSLRHLPNLLPRAPLLDGVPGAEA